MKSCIVHNADATRCGCSHEVSQADVHRKERTIHGPLGGIFQMLPPKGIDPDEKGPFRIVEETRRTSLGLETTVLSFTRA